MKRHFGRLGGLTVFVLAAFLLSPVFLGGCIGSIETGPPEMDESDHVSSLVSGLGDHSGSAKGFASVFADGNAPDEKQRAAYRDCSFRADSVEIDGQSATIQVTAGKMADGQILGQEAWTAVKQDGQWKLETAPLPQ